MREIDSLAAYGFFFPLASVIYCTCSFGEFTLPRQSAHGLFGLAKSLYFWTEILTRVKFSFSPNYHVSS